MNQPTDTDWAYLAGFVDGEGCISVSKGTRQWYPKLGISQNDQVVLLELYELFGVGRFKIWQPKEGKARARWNIYRAEHLRWILNGVLPYLRLKKSQAEVALHILDNRRDESAVSSLTELKVHRQLERR